MFKVVENSEKKSSEEQQPGYIEIEKGLGMARENKLKLVAGLVDADIVETEKKLDAEAVSGHYGEAARLGGVLEGLERALSHLQVAGYKAEILTKQEESK